jgi:hypothetical protein
VRRSRVTTAAALLCVLTASCLGPARTDDDYRLKAKSSAETALSAVGTARLVTKLAKDDRAFANYLSVLIGDAEEEAAGALDAFSSIQPPSEHSDALRDDASTLLSDANDEIASVRIAVRRGQLEQAALQDHALERIAARLERFVAEQT